MSGQDPDFAVIGSGPNGLVAACVLALAGYRVLVLEANPRRPGGAVGSAEWTRPGFVHDVGAGFFPFGAVSPAFRALPLESHGLAWCHAEIESCHPAPDGSFALIARDTDVSAKSFGSARDGETWRRIVGWYQRIEPNLLGVLLGTFPAVGPLLSLGPVNWVKLARVFASSARALSSRWFESEAARRVLPALGMHVDVAPDDTFGAALGFMLGMTATTGGYGVASGGAQSITNALVALLEAHGGRLRLGARVERIVVQNGRAEAVRVAGGEEISVSHGVLADTGAPSLLLDLIERQHVPARVVQKMQRFAWGWGTYKLDWALSGPVPWNVEPARQSAVVHAGDSLDDLSRFAREVRAGQLPERPYLVIGQQSLADPKRAPPGQHTLYAYTRVPSNVEGGWDAAREAFADRVEARIEELAPGFQKLVLDRHISAPPDLEAMDANLVGGDLGGGSNAWNHQLMWRPVFPWFRYRMPVHGLYLCSSFTHPGAGVHGMCGYNAAHVVLGDLT